MYGDEAKAGHKEQNPQRIQRDEQDVQDLMNTLTDWVNPFRNDSTHLTSLSSGCVTPADVQSDLEQAHCKGTAAFVACVDDWLVKNNKSAAEDLPLPVGKEKGAGKT